MKDKILLGKKIGMTQLIRENGEIIPVTVVCAGPCEIIEIKKHNEYQSIVLGFEARKEKKCNNPQKGYFKKLGVEPKEYLKEYKIEQDKEYKEKQEVTVAIFEENEIINVCSKSIGRGFTGTIKRHNFRRGPMAHGSKSHRITGSIGGGTTPGRVVKGKKMAGHHGNQNVTIKNLEIVKVDQKNNHLYIKGAIPGKKNNLVEIFN